MPSSPVFLNTTPPVFVNSATTLGSFSHLFTKLDFDLGCKVTKREDGNSANGVAGFLITNRVSKATIDPESVAEATDPIWGDLFAATPRIITGLIGTQSGNKISLVVKGVSETVTYGDRSGIRTQNISYSIERAASDTPGSQIALKFFLNQPNKIKRGKMNTELKMPVVTEDDVLKGLKEVEVLTRDGRLKKIIVKAMAWRVALKATFKPLDEAFVHMLENCVEKKAQALLDELTPECLVWLTNVAQKLTNGIEALKKANAAKAAATAPLATDSPISLPSSAN